MKAAVVQASTVVYDTPATMLKLEKLAEEAAKGGAKLILFPEAFIGGYPEGADFGATSLEFPTDEQREEYHKYFAASIEEHGPESQQIEKLAARLGVHIVTGVIERGGSTLYCAVFFYSPTGYLGKHRKVVPTYMERIVWGQGDGSTMPVFDTEFGKLGCTICHENYMPLFRVNMYSKGVQIYLAPAMTDHETWTTLMRAIALEGRCFVLSTIQYLKTSDYPKGHKIRQQRGEDEVIVRGGCCIIDPLGNFLVERDISGEVIRYADIDINTTVRGKFDLDTVGHYSRPDIFELTVNEKSLPGVIRK